MGLRHAIDGDLEEPASGIDVGPAFGRSTPCPSAAATWEIDRTRRPMQADEPRAEGTVEPVSLDLDPRTARSHLTRCDEANARPRALDPGSPSRA